MSTRSQIRFTDRHSTVQVYKHSDGYPEGTVDLLDTVRTVQDATGTARDATYTAANFVFVGKLTGMQMYANEGSALSGDLADSTLHELTSNPEEALEKLKQPHFLLGFGVEDPDSGIHGDEKWLYEFNTDNEKLAVIDLGHNDRGWDTQPEWVGTLDQAVDKYL
jgi:hypothetical protein